MQTLSATTYGNPSVRSEPIRDISGQAKENVSFAKSFENYDAGMLAVAYNLTREKANELGLY